MNGLYKSAKKEAPPRNQFVDSAVRLFASGFYAGYVPAMPGTAGALLGILVYMTTLLKMNLKPLELFFIYLVLYLIGSFICTLALEVFTEADQSLIVVDKILGGMIAVTAFAPAVWTHAWPRLATAFLIYRLWEIAKFFPLKNVEKLPKGFGVMSDDVVGALIALLITFYIPESLWDNLGWSVPPSPK
ncbi:MAG: phosphatidylglycerophosphatase A [Candidatus Riflebacteria bacterium]|nr:phosphatidylglycerophosphatase A [Candidatus Riflebacteria bacterium]